MLFLLSTVLGLALVFLPILGPVSLIACRKKHGSWWLLSAMLSSVVCYILLLSAVALTDLHLENELDKYDLNGDGSFSGDELTLEMEAAIDDFTSDTGRTFAPITGLFTCPLYSGFWHMLFGILYFVSSCILRRLKRGEQNGAGKTDPQSGSLV